VREAAVLALTLTIRTMTMTTDLHLSKMLLLQPKSHAFPWIE
jgi:hypothetical protein